MTGVVDGDPDGMEATVNISPKTRGTALLLHHCLTIGRDPEPRKPARERLEAEVGENLAGLLVFSLTPQGRRGSSSP